MLNIEVPLSSYTIIKLNKIKYRTHNESRCTKYNYDDSTMACLTKVLAKEIVNSVDDFCMIPQVWYFMILTMIDNVSLTG